MGHTPAGTSALGCRYDGGASEHFLGTNAGSTPKVSFSATFGCSVQACMAARLQLLLQAHETAGIHSAAGSHIGVGIGCGRPARLMTIAALVAAEQQRLLDRKNNCDMYEISR